jgi:UDP-N-acetylmuramate dehydrogenase
MIIKQNISLLSYNTFGIDVKANYFAEYESIVELQEILNSETVKLNNILHIGGGSNLLFLNDFKGLILHSKIKSIKIIREDEEFVFMEVGSGVVWDDFVAYCVTNGYVGVENLSLIPGEVGASAVQNIGAYGVEVQDLILEVKALEIESAQTRTFQVEECNYGYRISIFKNELKGKYIITSVVFKLSKKPAFKLNYQHLEEEVLKNGEISLQNIRKTIIAIRESKLPDTKLLGNAGSFFMNPVISKSKFVDLQVLYPNIPHYFVTENEEKLPAGWLIDQCGWKGKSIGNAAVHDKQALVLINKGDATGAEIVQLASEIQKSVKEKFGIELQTEVNYIS